MKFLWEITFIGWDLYQVTFNSHQAYAPDMTIGGYVCWLHGIEYPFCEELSTPIDILCSNLCYMSLCYGPSHPPRTCSLRKRREVLWPLSFPPHLHESAGRVGALSASHWYHISIFIRYKLTLTHNGIVKRRSFVCERGYNASYTL